MQIDIIHHQEDAAVVVISRVILSYQTGYTDDQIILSNRTLDKNMIRLNSEGFLNGHTPFSAIVAFSAVISAYINGKKYVVLSNEASANERENIKIKV